MRITISRCVTAFIAAACCLSACGDSAVNGSGGSALTLPVGDDVGHAQRIFSVTLSPDGQHIVSGSQDRTIKVWNVTDGALVRTLPVDGSAGHTDFVRSVVVTPDGQHIV